MRMRVISMLFWAYIAVSSVVLFIGALVIWLITLPFDRRLTWLHLYSSAWAYHYAYLWPTVTLTFEGREHLPEEPAVLAANHQSFADILVLYGLFHHFKWVSKSEIFKTPVIGWNMRMNRYVRLVRGDRGSGRAMLASCREHLAQGSSVMLCP